MKTITSATDLVTTRKDTIGGFRWQAEEKAKRGEPFYEIAKHFRTNASNIKSLDSIHADPKLFTFALGASALSAKSARQLGTVICKELIAATIDIKQLSDARYLAELESRYLLTCGDALGGTMRNVIGQRAQNIFSNHLVLHLKKRGARVHEITNEEKKITEIQWEKRTIVFDRKPKFIGKNIDFIMLDSPNGYKELLERPEKFLACGELKGGIDPAGADEHWKTARAALERVRLEFEKKKMKEPALFFICAAIEQAMAIEIFADLKNGKLKGAANLHHQSQLAELTDVLAAI